MSSVVDDIYGDIPAAKEPPKKRTKKTPKPRADTFFRTPLRPANSLKGILKPPTPITTTPDGTPLSGDAVDHPRVNVETESATTAAGVAAQDSSASTDECQDPAEEAGSPALDNSTSTDADPQDDSTTEADAAAARARDLQLEIQRLKAKMAARSRNGDSDPATTAEATTSSSTPSDNDSAASASSGQPLKRRVSFLMDMPKKKVQVDIESVLGKIQKALQRDKKFGKACALLQRLLEQNLDPVFTCLRSHRSIIDRFSHCV